MSKLLNRPARVQIDPEELNEEELPPQNGLVFNIWYNKWSGGNNEFHLIKAKHKLNTETDIGYTKADKQPTQQFFCLFFAKGMCCKGKKCTYLHRIPTVNDVFPMTVDCFGREKFSDYKDDMSGIGSFNKVNTTLYVSGLVVKEDTHDLLDQEFRRFGKIKKIYVLNSKNCAFITFKDEVSAQFAKEAMIGQSLYGTDVLNCKWAKEDPNPAAIKENKRQQEENTKEAVLGLLEKYEQQKQQQREQEEMEQQEPVVEEPVDAEPEQERAKAPKQITSSMFNSNSLSLLKQLQKKKKAKQNNKVSKQ